MLRPVGEGRGDAGDAGVSAGKRSTDATITSTPRRGRTCFSIQTLGRPLSRANIDLCFFAPVKVLPRGNGKNGAWSPLLNDPPLPGFAALVRLVDIEEGVVGDDKPGWKYKK